MLTIRLPQSVEKRLERLARRAGRTETLYIWEAILRRLEDLEDLYLAEGTLKRIRRRQRTHHPAETCPEAAWPRTLNCVGKPTGCGGPWVQL